MTRSRATPATIESLRKQAEALARSNPAGMEDFYEKLRSSLGDNGENGAYQAWIIGSTQQLLGNTLRALPELRKASRIFRSRGFAHEAARVDLSLMDALVCQGRFRAALRRGLRALEEFEKRGDSKRRVSALLNLGGLEEARNNIDAAVSYWMKARQNVGKRDVLRRALIETSIAGGLQELGRFRQAETAYRSALDLFNSSGASTTAILPQLGLAEIAALKGDPGQALRWIVEAEQQAKSCGDENLLAAARLAKGEIELDLGQSARVLNMAAEMADRAEKLGRLDDLARFTALEAVAMLQESAPGFEEKIEEASRALETHSGRPAAATFRVRLAPRYPGFSSSKLSGDAVTLEKAGLPIVAESARISAAEAAFREGKTESAQKTAEEILSRRQLLPRPRIRTHRLLSRMDEASAPSRAIRHIRVALRLAESIREKLSSRRDREFFQALLTEDYARLVRLLLRRGDARSKRQAFDAIARVKSRGLVEALVDGSDRIVGKDPDVALRWDELRNELKALLAALEGQHYGEGRFSGGSLTRRVQHLSRELEDLEIEAARRHPAKQPETLPASSLDALLKEGEYFLEAFFADGDLILFLLNCQDLKVFLLPNARAQCERDVDALRFQLSRVAYGRAHLEAAEAPLLQSIRARLARLGGHLLSPLAGLGSIKRLWISPHGVLHHIPMAALEFEGVPIIERCPVAVVPGADILARILSRPNPCPQHLGVVGAATDDLPEIESEIEDLSRFFEGVERSPDAKVEDVQAMLATCDAVHIASHGAFHASAAASSGFRLANGWLTAADLLRRPPTARMMSCGVCASGEVDVRPGEETMGVIRALLAGGVSTAIVAPGVLDDRIARNAARIFYEEVFVTDPGIALQKTLLDLRREHPHPALWAALQLYGNARPWEKVA